MYDDEKVYMVRGYTDPEMDQEFGYTLLAFFRALAAIFLSAIPMEIAMKIDGWLGRHDVNCMQGQPPFIADGDPGWACLIAFILCAVVFFIDQYKTWKKYSGRII